MDDVVVEAGMLWGFGEEATEDFDGLHGAVVGLLVGLAEAAHGSEGEEEFGLDFVGEEGDDFAETVGVGEVWIGVVWIALALDGFDVETLDHGEIFAFGGEVSGALGGFPGAGSGAGLTAEDFVETFLLELGTVVSGSGHGDAPPGHGGSWVD